MSIVYKDRAVVITDGSYSFSDLYKNCTDGSVQMLSESIYKITKDIYIGNRDGTGAAKLKDKNVTVIMDGEYFQTHKNSTLELGVKYTDGTTSDGVTLIMNNLAPFYAFGGGADITGDGRDPSLSGDLYLYNSKVIGRTFWSWFSSEDQHVEIIDCLIDGYGRIAGKESIVSNVIIEKAHGTYGSLSPKGNIKKFENITVNGVDTNGSGCAVYFNPTLTPNMRIIGGKYIGYKNLVYTEQGKGTLEFVDTVIEGNRNVLVKDNLSSVSWLYTFNPILLDEQSLPKVNADVKIYSEGDMKTVFEGVTDENGEIVCELAQYIHNGTSDTKDVSNYILDISWKDGDDITKQFIRNIKIESPIKKLPLYVNDAVIVQKSDSVDYTKIKTMLEDMKTDICACNDKSSEEVLSKVTEVNTGLNQVILGIGKDIKATTEYITGSDGSGLIL